MKKMNVKNKVALLAVVLSGAVMSGQAFAGSNSVSLVGQVDNRAPVLSGFSTGLPLVEALKQVVPNEWVVKLKQGETVKVDILEKVSWSGNKNWYLTIDEIISQTNNRAIVDFDKRELIIEAPVAPVVVQRAVNVQENQGVEVANSGDGQYSKDDARSRGIRITRHGDSAGSARVASSNSASSVFVTDDESKNVQQNQQPTIIKQTIVQDNVTVVEEVRKVSNKIQKSWPINTAKSLKENVIDWGNSAGWEVKWLTDDYQAPKRTFSGEFDAEDGPIAQLAKDYGQFSRLKKPLSFNLYENKVLVVEDLAYEQGGFTQQIED